MHPSALIARSQPMRQVAEEVRRFAAIDANVLVSGETGVGKSVIALALHTGGPRRRRPFVTIDCRSLPTTLIEAELFGVERGAFTGATRDKPGKFEAAGAGTIYLDGVDELSLDAQGKLLRLVETKRLERVGSLASIELHARLVASTGPDPEQAVRDALFRSDLYHRLRVLPIVVPPLRERRPDILPLARLFIRDAAARFGRSTKGLTTGASAAIEAYPWPGNVRELRHVIERSTINLEDTARERLDTADLPIEIFDDQTAYFDSASPRRSTLREVERRYIELTLRSVRGNQTLAARILGISRKSLWEKRKKFGLP